MDWELIGVLPKAGGTLDQDPGFMKDLRAILAMKSDIGTAKKQQADMQAEIKAMQEGGKTRRKL